MSTALKKFLRWIQAVFQGKKSKELPKLFEKKTAIFSWREGSYLCEGVLPNNTRTGFFYRLEVKPVRPTKSNIPHEIGNYKERVKSRIPTHRFQLTYQQALIINDKAVSSSPVPVFKIDISCWIPTKPTTDVNWNAVMKVAPMITKEITAICCDSYEEEIMRIRGVKLKEGQTIKKLDLSEQKSKVEYFKQYNKRKLLLTSYPSRTMNQSQEWWEEFIMATLEDTKTTD